MRATSHLSCTAFFVVLAAVVMAVAGAAFGAATTRAAPGSFVWAKVSDPTPLNDGLYCCAAGSRAVYAAGTTGWKSGDPTAVDMWVVKYRASGAQAWSRIWAGPDGRAEDLSAMVADAAGNVYVAGRTERSTGRPDSVVLKYDGHGTLKWATILAVEPVQPDEARAIGLDAHGNVYVVGMAYRTGNWDVYTGKLRPSDGASLWTSWYDSSGYDTGWSLAVTPAGVCYAGGTTGNDPATTAALLIKTRASGSTAWARTWNGVAGKADTWDTVSLAPSGNVVVGGEHDVLGPSDFVAATYTVQGSLKWARTWSSPGFVEDYPSGVAVALDGGIWMSGITDRAADGRRGALVKWSPAGKLRFARVVGTTARPAQLRALTVDQSGNAYVVGTAAAEAGGTWDLLAAKYSAKGRLGWRSRAGFGAGTSNSLDDIVLGGTGFLYASGSVDEDAVNGRAVVVKIRR
jgi:hypothetical protein